MRQDLYQQMYRQEEYYWWHQAKRALVKQFLPRKSNLRILDIGCGTGKLLQELSQFGSVWGVDANSQAISFCRRRGLKYVYQNQLPQIKLRQKFDVIICLDVLEHIATDTATLKTINRLLKPNGQLILTVPAYPQLFSYWDKILGHYRRYNRKQLYNLITKSGLIPIKISFVYTFLIPIVIPFRLFRHWLFRHQKPQSDFIELPRLLHLLLLTLAKLEQRLLRYINLPFGLSLICIARK